MSRHVLWLLVLAPAAVPLPVVADDPARAPVEDLETVERYIDGVRKTLPDELQPLYEKVRRFRDSTWEYVNGPMCFILAEPRLLIEPIRSRAT